MNKSDVQTCCVCGEKTEKRCSACGAVGIDLFFCSKDHQKLVWKRAHSRVCGDNANPFHAPNFTREETAEAIRLGHVDLASLDYGEGVTMAKTPSAALNPHLFRFQTLAESVCFILECSVEQFEEVVPALLLKSESLSSDSRTDLVKVVRNTVFNILQAPLADLKWLHLSPFYPTAVFQNNLVCRFATLDATPTYHHLSHLALILFSLLDCQRQSPPPPGFDSMFPLHALKELHWACSDKLTFTSSELAHDFHALVQGLCKPTLSLETRYIYKRDISKLLKLEFLSRDGTKVWVSWWDRRALETEPVASRLI
ncbi:hypothetical protein JCM6882_007501 [Rhodosporidiobolus microsporus]